MSPLPSRERAPRSPARRRASAGRAARGLTLLAATVSLWACGDTAQISALPGFEPLSQAAGQVANPAPEPPQDTLLEPLGLLSVEPSEGSVAGGEDVVIVGTGFSDGVEFFFGTAPATDTYLLDTTRALVRTPPHAAGAVDVSVTPPPDAPLAAPIFLEAAFRFVAPLTVDTVSPSEGDTRGGTPITARGTGFGPDARLFVGGRLAISQARPDDETLTGLTPPGAPGYADVHVVSQGRVAWARDAFRYRSAPRVDAVAPLSGPPTGGTLVRLDGAGLDLDAVVTFGAQEAAVVDAAHDGRWLTALSPPGPPGDVADVVVGTSWGLALAANAWSWDDPADDPYVLSCPTLFPSTGPAAGGTVVRVVCQGLQYGAQVTFDGAEAQVLTVDPEAGELTVIAPPAPQPTTGQPIVVRVSHDFGAQAVGQPFTYQPPPSVTLTEVAPAQGPLEGGQLVTLTGDGFAAGAGVWFGGLAASHVTVSDAHTIQARTPPGAPGLADVRVLQGGEEAALPGGYEYGDSALRLDLVTPAEAAQAGGTYLRVFGTGFDDSVEVEVGGEACPVIQRVSGARVDVRSPRLEVGTYDAVVRRGDGAQATLSGALTVFDPRSGYGGTWGPPIDETLNVTVRGTQKFGPIPGAFVIVGDDPATPFQGYTDDNGQLTFSEPGLYGPVKVTASHPDFDAYSVVDFDAANVTIYLTPKTPPPQSGEPPQDDPWPDATLRGRVLGLGKYVIAPPGSCEAAAIPETEHCAPCDPQAAAGEVGACQQDGFACLDLAQIPGWGGAAGAYCLASCGVDEDCPEGYVCAGATEGTRCMPAPGEKVAQCFVSNGSVFSTAPTVPDTGWVSPGGSFELPSGRLGDLAVVCLGGYRDAAGTFTPTVLGVRRHVFAEPGAVMEGLDVTLDHPLDRTLRLRMLDPPTWPTGVLAPSVTLSLDLGADGAIPFTRALLPSAASGGDAHTWLAPHQLSALAGDLYDATYFLYATMQADTATTMPRAYTLVQGVTSLVEDRLPVFDESAAPPPGSPAGGAWSLERLSLDADLYGIWGGIWAGDERIFAVGERGRLLLHTAGAWHKQSSGTHEDLLAVTGRGPGDVWVVGAHGTTLHLEGGAWVPIEPPAGAQTDTFRAAATAPGDPVWVAGTVRVRRYDDGADGGAAGWSIEGPPSLQDIHGLYARPGGRVAAVGSGGRVLLRGAEGTWELVPTSADADDAPTTTLRAVWFDDELLVAVGDAGTILERQGDEGPLTPVTDSAGGPLTRRDLTAVTGGVTAQGARVIFAVGDGGVALRRLETSDGGATWVRDVIPDYRSRAFGVYARQAPGGDVGARVVGSAAFILGPYLQFPIITAPLHDAQLSSPELGWSWDGGEGASYTRLVVSDEYGPALWTLIVDGNLTSARLPDIPAAAGYSPLGSGKRRLDVTRVLNPTFDIDGYTTRDFSIYHRDSWSQNQSFFYVP